MRALLISANVFVVQTKLHFSLLVKYNTIHPVVSCMGFDKELFLITVITYLDGNIEIQLFFNGRRFSYSRPRGRQPRTN